MKFALFLLGSWTEEETSAQSRIFSEMLEQTEYAEELGFDSVWIAEHHSSRYGICPSLMPLLSHIAARTSKIRIGAGVSVLPFHNPIFLAEESAMLDVLSHGRLDFGVGRGSADYEYGNFNIDFDTRDVRTQEALDIILGLWTQDNFSFDGEFYQVKDLTIAPKPVQQPHPPVYLAVSRTPASVDVAVERDLPILTSFSMPEADNLSLFSLYADRCAAAGKALSVAEMPYFRFVYLDEDEAAAAGISPAVIDVGARPGRLPAHPEPRRRDKRGPGPVAARPHRRTGQLRVGTGYHLLLRRPGPVCGADNQAAGRLRHRLLRRQHVLRQHGAFQSNALNGAVRQGSNAQVPLAAASGPFSGLECPTEGTSPIGRPRPQPGHSSNRRRNHGRRHCVATGPAKGARKTP